MTTPEHTEYTVVGRPIRFWVGAAVVLVFAGVAVQHQLNWWHWYIEDAAISFAYARNWAWGEGLVATPGSERLEGYSNFTWVALLAFFEWFRVDRFNAFNTSKVLQAVLAFGTVIMTALTARGVSTERMDGAGVAAAGFLATASTFAIWGASGLENSLFGFLLSVALYRTLLDLRGRTYPWAALLWCLLAISRPEAILYAAVAGFLTMLFTLRRGLRPTIQWLVTFFLPFVSYHWVRYQYFAFEFPQTYYGKMNNKNPQPFQWNRRGWKYVREWSHALWTGYYLPIWALALFGTRGAKAVLAAIGVIGIGGIILFPGILPEQPIVIGPLAFGSMVQEENFPDWWFSARSYSLIVFAISAPLLAVQTRKDAWAWVFAFASWALAPVLIISALSDLSEWDASAWLLFESPALILFGGLLVSAARAKSEVQVQILSLCWGIASAVFFFAIYAQGDWMKSWRWMSLLQVPLAILFGAGVSALGRSVEELLDWASPRVRVPATVLGMGLWSVAQMSMIVVVWFYGGKFAYGRWNALALGQGALVFALVAGLVRGRLRLHWGPGAWSVVSLLVAMTALPNLAHTKKAGYRPETGPFSIKKRVEFVKGIRSKLELEHRIVDLDVDQGGHLWWGRDDFRMMDLAGLVDIPLAQHRFKRPFVHEYIFEEMKPHFAHVHGGWASNSRLRTHPEWGRDYVEIPGFPAGSTKFHIGNFVRRDLFLRRSYEHRYRVEFEDGFIFEGIWVPSEAGVGRKFWFEVAFQDTKRRKAHAPVRITVFAADATGVKHSWDLPMNYGWLLPEDWKPKEIFVGKFAFDVPETMPEGVYDLGFVITGPTGELLSPVLPTDAPQPQFAQGEIVLPGALTIVSNRRAAELARDDREEATLHAEAGRCEQAEASWFLSRKHRPKDEGYLKEKAGEMKEKLSTCWANRAEKNPATQVELLVKAHDWDHRAPRYLEVRGPVADRLFDIGMRAREEQAWEVAYRAFRDCVRIDPTRSWARRYAEEARSIRLGLPGLNGKGREKTKK